MTIPAFRRTAAALARLGRRRFAGNQFISRLAADRRGNILAIMGFVSLPLVFAIGFGVDYSRAEKAQTRLDGASDAAALSAVSATAMNQSTVTNANQVTTPSGLAAAAINTFVSEVPGYSGGVVTPTVTSSTVNDAVVTYALSAPTNSGMSGTITVTAHVATTGALNTGRTATVTWQGKSRNSFGALFTPVMGHDAGTLAISGTSQASADAAPNINFYLAMDSSPSMLLPSTSDGLANIRAAFAATVNSPYGCDFACHEQNPHNDNIYVYDSTGREVYLPTTVYSSNGTNNQTYMFVNETTGVVYDTNTTAITGDRYCSGTVYSGATTCSTSGKTAIAGHWADGYWLTHNYNVLHPGSGNIDLRINDEMGAAQDLIPFAQQQSTANQVTYRMQMFSWDWTDTTAGETSPVTTLTSTMANVSTLTTASVPNIDNNELYWYANNCPYNGTCNSDEGTEVSNMLTKMNAIMATPGDGSSTTATTGANAPQEVLFIITDGVSDESGRYVREWSSSDLAKCTTIKNRGIRIAILYTQYLPDALTGDSWSQSTVAPYVPNVIGALQSCASTGSSGAPLFYEVTTDQSISQALTALFSLTIQSAHLVK